MTILKTKGALRVYAGDGMARGLFIGENIKTGRVSYWATSAADIKLGDCIY